jgi:hypothetical protein
VLEPITAKSPQLEGSENSGNRTLLGCTGPFQPYNSVNVVASRSFVVERINDMNMSSY